MDDNTIALLKFKAELLAVFRRWMEESDLEDMELVEACVETMNDFCEEEVAAFEPDPDFLEKLRDAEEED